MQRYTPASTHGYSKWQNRNLWRTDAKHIQIKLILSYILTVLLNFRWKPLTLWHVCHILYYITWIFRVFSFLNIFYNFNNSISMHFHHYNNWIIYIMNRILRLMIGLKRKSIPSYFLNSFRHYLYSINFDQSGIC